MVLSDLVFERKLFLRLKATIRPKLAPCTFMIIKSTNFYFISFMHSHLRYPLRSEQWRPYNGMLKSSTQTNWIKPRSLFAFLQTTVQRNTQLHMAAPGRRWKIRRVKNVKTNSKLLQLWAKLKWNCILKSFCIIIFLFFFVDHICGHLIIQIRFICWFVNMNPKTPQIT